MFDYLFTFPYLSISLIIDICGEVLFWICLSLWIPIPTITLEWKAVESLSDEKLIKFWALISSSELLVKIYKFRKNQLLYFEEILGSLHTRQFSGDAMETRISWEYLRILFQCWDTNGAIPKRHVSSYYSTLEEDSKIRSYVVWELPSVKRA